MNMDTMYKLEEMCCRELDKIAQRGELSSSTLQQAAMLVDTVKDVKTIEAMEEEQEAEYSQNGGSYGNGSYDDGGSYAGRRGHYVRAHYSRDGGGSYAHGGNGQGMSNTGGGSYDRDSRGRYSREGEKDDMIQRLERMMSQSNDPGERQAYERAMEQLRNA